MIQRTQTLFLALVVVAACGVVGFPIWEKSSAALNEKVVLSAMNLIHTKAGAEVTNGSTIYIAGLALLSAILALVSITQFKKRVLQMTIGAINSAVIAATLGTCFYQVFLVGIPMFEPEAQGSYTIGFYAAALALLGNMIANRLIRRDEMLVRSADRMR